MNGVKVVLRIKTWKSFFQGNFELHTSFKQFIKFKKLISTHHYDYGYTRLKFESRNRLSIEQISADKVSLLLKFICLNSKRFNVCRMALWLTGLKWAKVRTNHNGWHNKIVYKYIGSNQSSVTFICYWKQKNPNYFWYYQNSFKRNK